MKSLSILALIFLTASLRAETLAVPDPTLTPGDLCTRQDPNFDTLDYPEQVARCKRNIQKPEKEKVAQEYGGIPESAWPQYEFDHMIPLCAGGSDNILNLWPQPIDQAKKKDVLENDVCLAMKAGTMTQATAVQKVHDWFASGGAVESVLAPQVFDPVVKPGEMACATTDGEVVRFVISGPSEIVGLSIALVVDDVEHTAVKLDKALEARPVRHPKTELFDGFMRYTDHEKDGDRFDLYLPEDLNNLGSAFSAYLKVSFGGNFPKLSTLSCKQ